MDFKIGQKHAELYAGGNKNNRIRLEAIRRAIKYEEKLENPKKWKHKQNFNKEVFY